MTPVRVAITMADVEAMSPGPRRDELAYAVQSKSRTATKAAAARSSWEAVSKRTAEQVRVRADKTFIARGRVSMQLERQDARISRCPGCDDWQWDKTCNRCTTLQKAA